MEGSEKSESSYNSAIGIDAQVVHHFGPMEKIAPEMPIRHSLRYKVLKQNKDWGTFRAVSVI